MKITADLPDFASAMNDTGSQMALAMTRAMRDCAELAKRQASKAIAGAGFPAEWVDSMQDVVKPHDDRGSFNPSATIFSSIPFAGVFDIGATIQGRPLLWLPIEANLPSGKWTPKTYQERFGNLVSVNVAGRKPLLVDRQRRLAVFVGIDAIHIPKKFDVTGAIEQAVDQFDAIYDTHIAVISNG